MLNEFLAGLPLYLAVSLSIIIIIVDSLSGKNKIITYIFSIITFIAIIVAAFYTYFGADLIQIDINTSFTRGMISYGGLPSLFDIIFAVSALLTVIAGMPYLKREFDDFKEFYTLILFSTTGMMMIAHANHLIMIFIGIELMSISFYVLSGFIRVRITAVEAALKYFLLGSFATGFLLYGMALIYGSTQTMYLSEIHLVLMSGSVDFTFLRAGFALLIVGLGFKVAAFPFHQWAPDVYQGAPTVVTAFMSTAGKAGALVAFVIIGQTFLPTLPPDLINEVSVKLQSFVGDAQMILALMASATMLVGNLLALIQKNIKRMLAYSSVAHAGYLLIGIVSNNADGWSGVIFYSAAYMFMQIGAFVVVSILERNDKKLELTDYNGLRKQHPWLAAMMAIFMFSLAGIPPFAGFPGKYLLFVSAVEAGYTWLTIVAVISTIISMYFYIGLIINMFFNEQEGEPLEAKAGSVKITLAITTIFVILLGIFPGVLINMAKRLF